VCRRYRCKLLKLVEGGEVETAAALEIIAETIRYRDRARATAESHLDPPDSDALREGRVTLHEVTTGSSRTSGPTRTSTRPIARRACSSWPPCACSSSRTSRSDPPRPTGPTPQPEPDAAHAIVAQVPD